MVVVNGFFKILSFTFMYISYGTCVCEFPIIPKQPEHTHRSHPKYFGGKPCVPPFSLSPSSHDHIKIGGKSNFINGVWDFNYILMHREIIKTLTYNYKKNQHHWKYFKILKLYLNFFTYISMTTSFKFFNRNKWTEIIHWDSLF